MKITRLYLLQTLLLFCCIVFPLSATEPINIEVDDERMGDAKAIHDEDVIGSPKITSEIPEDLRCQEGWVDVGYDISNTGEIVNVRILRSEPAGMFDQYALNSFERLKYHLLRAKRKNLKGVSFRFTYAARDTCK